MRLIAITFLASAFALPAAATTLPSDAQILQMLSTRVDLQKQATGIVVGIAEPKDNRIVAYGTVGLDDKRPVNGKTVFDLGSITKIFTALLLSDMAEQHEVSIDDPVSKYLPGKMLPSRDGREITLADLATHTSGLPLRPANLPSQNPADPYAGYSREKLFAFLSTYKLSHTPGSTYSYSNVGFGLLGITLAERAKTSYGDLVSARITGPLGMNDTRIIPTQDMERRAATGYDGALHPVPHWEMGVLSSAGAYRSTADDLLKLADAFLGFRKTVLYPAMNAMTETRRPGGMDPATAIAFAWNIYDDNGREIVWKNGSVGGYRAFIGFDKKARLGIVALDNAQSGSGADDIALHLLDPAYHVDLHIPHAHKEIALDPAILDRYVGVYRYSANDILTVRREGGHLVSNDPSTGPLEWFPEGPNDFFLKTADAQITFDTVMDGHATKAIWHESGQDQIGARVK